MFLQSFHGGHREAIGLSLAEPESEPEEQTENTSGNCSSDELSSSSLDSETARKRRTAERRSRRRFYENKRNLLFAGGGVVLVILGLVIWGVSRLISELTQCDTEEDQERSQCSCYDYDTTAGNEGE